jgi:hypothetical protein
MDQFSPIDRSRVARAILAALATTPKLVGVADESADKSSESSA